MIYCNFKSGLVNTYADSEDTLNKYLKYIKSEYDAALSFGYEIINVDKIIYDPGGMFINAFPNIKVDIFEFSLQHHLDFYEELDNIEYHTSGILRGSTFRDNFIISEETYARVLKELKSRLGKFLIEYKELYEKWKQSAKSKLPNK